MTRFVGMLTGILITISLYFLYLDHNLQTAGVAAGIEAIPAMPGESASPDLALPPLPRIPDQDVANKSTESTSNSQPPTADSVQLEALANLIPQEVVFWRPFHSRYSATGFARRMTDATGVKVHVLPVDKKQYRVAFNYLDENDRLSKISIIENITGLELEP